MTLSVKGHTALLNKLPHLLRFFGNKTTENLKQVEDVRNEIWNWYLPNTGPSQSIDNENQTIAKVLQQHQRTHNNVDNVILRG